MLIDASYFVGELNIPSTGSLATQERLNWFIQKYEPEFLQKLMGYPLWKAFTAANPLTDPRLIALLSGAEYTDWNGYLNLWVGLIIPSSSGVVPRSPIANYVYYRYMRSIATQTTGSGETLPQAENAKTVSARAKMTSAWNEMSQWVCDFNDFLQQSNMGSSPVYPEWTNTNKIDALRFFGFINPFF